LKNPL